MALVTKSVLLTETQAEQRSCAELHVAIVLAPRVFREVVRHSSRQPYATATELSGAELLCKPRAQVLHHGTLVPLVPGKLFGGGLWTRYLSPRG